MSADHGIEHLENTIKHGFEPLVGISKLSGKWVDCGRCSLSRRKTGTKP
jgi:hypothetical protein